MEDQGSEWCYAVSLSSDRDRAMKVTLPAQSRPRAACVITSTTASGFDSIRTWLEWTVTVVAFMVCAIIASSWGGMTRSSEAIMYQDGFNLKAGAVAGVPNATPATGPWVTTKVCFS